MNDRTGFRSRHQGAVSAIRTIGECFTGRSKSDGFSSRYKLGARQADQDQRSID
jgi:hypothetical protein